MIKSLFLLCVSLLPVAANAADDSAAAYSQRDNAIGLMINDFEAKDNKLKTAGEIEKYHRCLLSDKAERPNEAAYDGHYKFLIAQATETFDVPVGMLTCLCGRESRFEANEVNDESGATGICQSLDGSLADVERWRQTNPKIKAAWQSFVTHLGPKLEDASCATQPLSPPLLKRCPSLGLGVASIYLKFVYSRVQRNADFGDTTWSAQSVDTLTTVAGAYYAGAGVADKALHGLADRSMWNRAMMHQVCVNAKAKGMTPDWMHTRLSTLRNHMQAVRNCIMAGNWLDHQGNPMGGECKDANADAQVKSMKTFRDSLPVECE
jgi:hypothetical protein